MNDKALSRAELELTRKIQLHFPRGTIPAEVLGRWGNCPKETLTEHLQRVFSQEPEMPTKKKEKKNRLLKHLGTVDLVAANGAFVASEWFVVNTDASAAVKISFLDQNFRDHFLGKTEQPELATALRYQELLANSLDPAILAVLGGEHKAETLLSQMFSLMAKQPNGEEGVLLNNGWASIFYIRDKKGVLWAVRASWCGGGWDVFAFSVGYPDVWGAGRRVFSRKSGKKPSGS